ncbi:MAG: protein kinase [Deltaproteobacteria bacterium]|nr:protein kinase [Deltaproteobacteria bacterium]
MQTTEPQQATSTTDAVAATVPATPPNTPPLVTPMPGVSDRWAGTDLDYFHIVRQLGRGGMGAVYLAHDTSLDRKVAIKILPEHLYGHAEVEARFLREARAQAKLASPNVVAIHHIGRLPTRGGSKGGLYFAMELVDGEPLDAILERKSMLHPEEARQAMIHVARGLRDAHREGIIHRDIKPSNILRDKHGWVKLADFGIAKVNASPKDDKALTQDGVVLGTPLYMAPEQAAGEELDHRADMYSLGCAFYHLIAGAPVFDGNNGLHVAAQHISAPPMPLGEVIKDLPPKLGKIFDRLLKKPRDERYPDYDALIADLEAAAPETLAYAGFWARGAAMALDCVVAGTLVAFLGWIGVVVHLAYVTVGHAYFGRTLPKWMLSIRVHKKDGTRLGLPRALLRTLVSLWLPIFLAAVVLVTQGTSHLRSVVERLQPLEAAEAKSILLTMAISNAVFTLLWLAGMAMTLFNPERRALHDLMSGSRVTYAFRRVSIPSAPAVPRSR